MPNCMIKKEKTATFFFLHLRHTCRHLPLQAGAHSQWHCVAVLCPHTLCLYKRQKSSKERPLILLSCHCKKQVSISQWSIGHSEQARKLTSTLLGFDQPGGTVHADNQTACDFGVKRAAMARFVHTQDALDPRHHFVRGRVGWLVKVNET